MTTEVIATDVAEAEFERFLGSMRLRFNLETMDAEDRTGFKNAKEIIIGAMQDGRLIINDKGEPVFTPESGGDPITFYQPTGATLMVMDQHKNGQDVHKSYAAMAAQTKTSSIRFSNMPMPDLRVCRNLTMLFLTST